MEIVKMPIVDFFKYSLDSACERGFFGLCAFWHVMLMLKKPMSR